MSEPQTKKTKVSTLDQLKALTTIVADTGDFEGTFQQVHLISTSNQWLEHIEPFQTKKWKSVAFI